MTPRPDPDPMPLPRSRRRAARPLSARPLAAALLLAAGPLAGPALAGPVDVRYAISLVGLPIGSASLDGTVSDGAYAVAMRARLTGLVGAFVGGKGAATAQGAVRAGRPVPSGYALSASNDKLTRTIQLGQEGGTVREVRVVPPFEDDKADRVPVQEGHKRGALDPLSGFVMPVKAGLDPLDPANCERVVPVFDGAQRFDMRLSPAGTVALKRKGYEGPALVCAARYVPVSGHRPARPATKFMTENRDISVTLVPVADARVLVPAAVSVRTTVGVALIDAESLAGVAPPATLAAAAGAPKAR